MSLQMERGCSLEMNARPFVQGTVLALDPVPDNVWGTATYFDPKNWNRLVSLMSKVWMEPKFAFAAAFFQTIRKKRTYLLQQGDDKRIKML